MNINYELFDVNNINCIYLPRTDNNITSISVFCRVGSINEPQGLEGASRRSPCAAGAKGMSVWCLAHAWFGYANGRALSGTPKKR